MRSRSYSVLVMSVLFCVVFAWPSAAHSDVANPPQIVVPEKLPPHPRLFLNTKEIDRLKDWAQREPWLRQYVDEMVQRLEKTVDQPRLPSRQETANVEIAQRAHEFAIADVLRGDRRYAEAAATILKAYIKLFPT